MRTGKALLCGVLDRTLLLALCAALVAASASITIAGGNFGGGSSVGGVFVNPEGVLDSVSQDDMEKLLKTRAEALGKAAGDLSKPTKLRVVSLKKLQQAIRDHRKARPGHALPSAIKYLAGLTRIQYVLVYPEQKDIVLAGPAEGWKLNAVGEVVGATSGKSLLKLDDLVVALRSTAEAGGGIQCSIDPTEEGVQRFQQFMAKQRRQRRPFGKATVAGIEKAMGDQTIRVGGVPANSHFAQVLVASDFRMKQYAMGLADAPIKGLPSYLSLLKRPGSAMPRWWMAADYKPTSTDSKGLAWELHPGVKVLTEDEVRAGDGGVQGTGRSSAAAQKWADAMTSRFDELAAKDSIFAELQNCMDMAVVAAMLTTHKLDEKAGLDMSLLRDKNQLLADTFVAPRKVATRVSFVKRRGQWIISASGGVQYYPYQIIGKTKKSDSLGAVRSKVAPQGKAWWRN